MVEYGNVWCSRVEMDPALLNAPERELLAASWREKGLRTGLILLASGAHRYIAVDVNDWATRTPEAFYEVLDERLETNLRQEVVTCRQPGGRIEYVIDPDFQIDKLGPIDIVVSHSAF